MKRLEVWLKELYFEDNERFGRRASRIASVVTKALLTVPHAFMFLFCNFGSAVPRRAFTGTQTPNDALHGHSVQIEEWPRSERGFDRGLPFSDGTVAQLRIGTALARVDDLRFVLSEIRRVCQAAATVTIRHTDASDPFQRRPINRNSISYFVAEGFRIVSEDAEGTVLEVSGSERINPHPRRIDVGCGSIPREGYSGVDRIALPGVAIVRDVERHGLPFSDGTITHVHTAHFLEHVDDLVFVMNEIHRVCCANAIVTVSVPTLLGPFSAADPTHVHQFNARTFRYFEAEKGANEYAGIVKGFEILEQRVGFSLQVTMRVIKDAGMPSAQTIG